MISQKSSHISSGLRQILEVPFIYNLWQLITGSEFAKKHVISNYVAPYNNARLLDIGCGTGVMLDHIPEMLNVKYVGYDINKEYIKFAKDKYGKRGNFYCTSVDQATTHEDNFDIVSAIAILHHLDNDESEILIDLAKRSLKEGGVLVLSEPVYTPNQSKLEKYLMSNDRGQNIRTEQEYLDLVSNKFTHIEKHVLPNLHTIPWTICVLRCR